MSFSQYMLSIMKGDEKGPAAQFIGSILYLLSLIYGTAVKVIDWTYRTGIRPRYKINVPVISVGNLTLGGTGKTPFTVFLADYFLASGRKCAVLIRGYGKDECLMLKDELGSAALFVGQDRVKNAKAALSKGSDVIVLDDGFQHRRLRRDLDILLVDAFRLFGNNFLFPRGILREHISAAKRADIFVLTKIDRLEPPQIENAVKELKKIDIQKPIIKVRHRISFISGVAGSSYQPGYLKGKRIFLVSGIADPDYFDYLVSRESADIVLRQDYPDHYRYTQKDIAEIEKRALEKNVDNIITTKKDYVKLKQLDISGIEKKLFVLNIVIDIAEGKDEFLGRLDRVVSN